MRDDRSEDFFWAATLIAAAIANLTLISPPEMQLAEFLIRARLPHQRHGMAGIL